MVNSVGTVLLQNSALRSFEAVSSSTAVHTLTANLIVIGLLGHLNANPSRPAAQGVGIDYNAALIQTAIINSDLAGVSAEWLIYDFNEDQDDLVKQLVSINHVTHLFIYLLPKQLALRNVRAILTRLYDSGVVVCCHKYHPDYLTGVRFNKLMELIVYERVIAPGMG